MRAERDKRASILTAEGARQPDPHRRGRQAGRHPARRGGPGGRDPAGRGPGPQHRPGLHRRAPQRPGPEGAGLPVPADAAGARPRPGQHVLGDPERGDLGAVGHRAGVRRRGAGATADGGSRPGTGAPTGPRSTGRRRASELATPERAARGWIDGEREGRRGLASQHTPPPSPDRPLPATCSTRPAGRRAGGRGPAVVRARAALKGGAGDPAGAEQGGGADDEHGGDAKRREDITRSPGDAGRAPVRPVPHRPRSRTTPSTVVLHAATPGRGGGVAQCDCCRARSAVTSARPPCP